MKRKCLEGDGCPVARALDVVGDWWTLLIIRDAFAGVTRFGDFQQSEIFGCIIGPTSSR